MMKNIMNCPYCNKEMRAGYIQSPRGTFFTENEKGFLILRNPKKDKKIIGVWETSSPAFYCDDCDCLIWKKN